MNNIAKNNIVKEVRNKFLATIEKHNLLTEGMVVVLGFSGGPDSLCLFDLILSIEKEWGLKLYPVHVNHNLRGESADKDQSFCENYSLEHGLKCEVFSFDCEQAAKKLGITTEEAGRRFRYDAFMKTAEKAAKESSSPVAIAVAHNADDQAETVLMRVIRGTGVDGLAGIPYKRTSEYNGQAADEDVTIVRPLLDITKEEILCYCEERNLNPCLDLTNYEPLYGRNKIRLDLIPEIEKTYNPSVRDALLRLSDSASKDREFLEMVATAVYENAKDDEDGSREETNSGSRNENAKDEGVDSHVISLDRRVLVEGHPAISRRVIALALKDAGLVEDVGSVHYAAIDDVINSENPSAETNLPGGFSAWRVYESLKLGKKNSENAKPDDQENGPSIEVRELTIDELDATEKIPNTYAAFDYELLKREFGEAAINLMELRSRRAGDIIKTMGGSKKLQDLLVDMKIPKEERDDVKLVAIGNQVLWVIPNTKETRPRYSSKWRISEETRKIAYIVLLV